MSRSESRQLRILSVAPSAMLPNEIAVDLFAGGGGWSEGFQWATGVPPSIAVNHDANAIEMHRLNHPESEHHQENVFTVDPVAATRGRSVGWLHASPDCRHFSRAKGSVPRTARALSTKIRGLAWIVVRWAAAVQPRIISLENVAEFMTWCPLHQQGPRAGQPMRHKKGETFRKFVTALQNLGYAVDWRELRACDFGAPTSRKRLFLVARRDGLPIVWPAPTHGPRTKTPYRTAAECIDWSISCPSIFDRKKPLADATLRRIAEGIRRFVLNNPRPFIVNLTHGGRVEDIDDPMRTVTAAHRSEKAIVTPVLIANNTNNAPQPIDDPLCTITTGNRHYVVAPALIQTGHGERTGQSPRVFDLHVPLTTVVAGGQKHGLVAAFLAKHYGGHETPGSPITAPVDTVTAQDHHALVTAHLISHFGQSIGSAADAPAPAITAGGGGHAGIVAAHLTKYYGSDEHGQAIDEPLHTIPTVDRFGLVAAFLTRFNGTSTAGESANQPLGAITAAGQHFGVVTVAIAGETYAIADIGMRMLQPRELARAQGFPDSYLLTGTKTQQVARVGNSVPPQFPKAIVAANLSPKADDETAERAA